MNARDQTLVTLLRTRAAEHPDRVAYIFLDGEGAERERLTYADLDRRARAVAVSLGDEVAPGDRVLLLLPPGLEFLTSFFGCLYRGAVAVPSYPVQGAQDVAKLTGIVANAGARVVLAKDGLLGASSPTLASLPPPLAELRWLSVASALDAGADAWRPPAIDPGSLALLQYTSGSTGTPRGVMVSHRNLLHNFQVMTEAFGHNDQTIIVSWLPLFHDMGLIGNALQAFYSGVTGVLMSPAGFIRRPVLWLSAITRYRGTFSGAPNFAYDLCVRRINEQQRSALDLSSWDVAFNGSEPIRAEVLDRFIARFAPSGFRAASLFPCYGLAEGTLFVSGGDRAALPVRVSVDRHALEEGRVTATEGSEARVLVGCGRAWAGQHVHIVDPATLTPSPTGTVGEIWLTGDSVTWGYWEQPELSQQTFPTELAGVGKGRYLRTGDLGFIQGDDLYITGRLKEVIIIHGRNHSPEDIERTVDHSSDVLRPGYGAAFSVDLDGEERLVVAQEVTRGSHDRLDVKTLLGDVRAAVSNTHGLQLHELCLIRQGTIPKTSSGKIQRRACRSLFLAGKLSLFETRSTP